MNYQFMLEHQMKVIKNVSQNKLLFKKEINKSLEWLDGEEIYTLKSWLDKNFRETHGDIIDGLFDKDGNPRK